MADERKRIDPERYHAVVEHARRLNAARRELEALRDGPLLAFEDTDALFAAIDNEIRVRRILAIADHAQRHPETWTDVTDLTDSESLERYSKMVRRKSPDA